MCYFLYGGINEDANAADLKTVKNSSAFAFRPATHDEITNCIATGNGRFRLTHSNCDCDTAVGSGNATAQELKNVSGYIHNLRAVRNARHIYLAKNFTNEKMESEQTCHVDEIDLAEWLAHIKNNCLYKIQLFKKYC
jgi:hypothetical protein